MRHTLKSITTLSINGHRHSAQNVWPKRTEDSNLINRYKFCRLFNICFKATSRRLLVQWDTRNIHLGIWTSFDNLYWAPTSLQFFLKSVGPYLIFLGEQKWTPVRAWLRAINSFHTKYEIRIVLHKINIQTICILLFKRNLMTSVETSFYIILVTLNT